MKVEDPIALRFILQDELYLLNQDKDFYSTRPDSSNPDSYRDHPDQDNKPQPEIETPQLNFNYLGANKKNFLILLSYPEHESMPDAHLTALESVLSRKGHSRDDVAILDIAKHVTADYDQISAYFKPQTLVLLGKGSIPVGMEQPPFNLPENRGELDLLYTFGFDEMMADNTNKKAFWDQIKTL